MPSRTERQQFLIPSENDQITLDSINKNWKTLDNYSLISTKTASTTLSGGSTVKMNWHIITYKATTTTKYVLMHGYANISSLAIDTNVNNKSAVYINSKQIKVPLPIALSATYNVQMNYASTNAAASKGPRFVFDYSTTPSSNYGELICKIGSTTAVTADKGRLYVSVFGKAVN